MQAQSLGKIGHWEYDHRAKKFIWSDEVYNIFNVSKHSFSNLAGDYLKLVHKDDIKLLRRTYITSLREKSSFELVHRVAMSDGSTRYVKEMGVHEFDLLVFWVMI